MTKSELIVLLADRLPQLTYKEVENSVKHTFDHLSHALSVGKRIEIRGFGSFSLHHRPARVGRNPKTGSSVHLEEKYVPHFKAGKEMRERVNQSLMEGITIKTVDEDE